MPLSKRTALGVSIVAIVLYWIYVAVSQLSDPSLPAGFSALVLRIVRTKVLVFAALFALLRLGGEGWDSIGVRRSGWPRHLGVGLIIGFAMFLAMNVALNSVLNALIPRAATDGSERHEPPSTDRIQSCVGERMNSDLRFGGRESRRRRSRHLGWSHRH